MNDIKLDVREDYLDIKIIQSYIERWSLGLESTDRTLSEFLADNYELLQFQSQVDQDIINDLQRLLMKIRRLDTISEEIKKEIDGTVVGMF